MLVQNIGTNRWRVIAKTGADPETGKPTYLDTTIKGTKQDAKDLEAAATVFDRRKLSGMTLEAFMRERWLPSLEVASNTYDYYEGTARRPIWPALGSVPLRDIDVPMLEEYFAGLPRNSVRTCAKKTLSGALGQAARWSLIQANPVSLLRVKSPRKRRRRLYRTFTREECLRLQEVLRGTSIEALCLVMLNAGARREEGCALDWEDFEWEGCSAEVERAYTVRSGTGECEMKDPKNDESWRALYFDGYAADRLYELSIGDSGPICKAPDGSRMRPDRAQELFSALCALFGLPTDVPINHLRHTFITQHVEDGTDLATLKSLVGHTSVSTIIDNYIIPREEAKIAAQGRMAKRLDPRNADGDSEKRA